MKKLLLLLDHKIIKIGLIIVIVLVGFFLFYEQEIKEKAVNVSQGKFPYFILFVSSLRRH